MPKTKSTGQPAASFQSNKNPGIKKARASAMVAARISGKPLAAVAEQFNCSLHTVERTLDWAERAGLVAKAEDKILEELVPLAVEAYKKALAEGDTFVAKDVLSGTGILKKAKEQGKFESGPTGPDEMTLELFLLRRREKKDGKFREEIQAGASRTIAATSQRELAAPNTIDAQVIEETVCEGSRPIDLPGPGQPSGCEGEEDE